MEPCIHLQEIIGTDPKKNPFFTVCKHPDHPGKLWVYFGTVLLETIEEDRNHFTFKLLVARLYNAGLKIETLTDAFGVPYSTMRRWGHTVKSGDTEQLLRMFAGRAHPRKLTLEIQSFARQRFSDIYPDNKYSYSHQIRQEIQDVFAVSISGETLRAYFTEWKKQWDEKRVETVTIPAQQSQPSELESCQEDSHEAVENNHLVGPIDVEGPTLQTDAADNRKHVVALPVTPTCPDYQFCHHVGLLLFSSFLHQCKQVLGESGEWIKQWMGMILLGATNIEQSKLLGREALRTLLGPVVANLHLQRQALGELTATDCLAKLLRLNGEWVGIDQCHDFYYDPHSKHYTGAHKILKGWCSRLRFAEKVLHMDFIHTAMGYPVYLHNDDNYYDLRERFFAVVKAFRQQFDFDPQRSLTFIIDRGIYSLEVFQKINSEDALTYFVTWEKGYQSKPQESMQWTSQFKIYKAKNNRNDLNAYTFKYVDELWPREPKIRRLIVQATNPKGNTIQVSILTNDLQRRAEQLIELMFSRWLQENDFKYLDTHFGINEITSYGVVSYQRLEKTLQDKQVKSGVYKALEKQRAAIKKQLKEHLLRKHCATKDDQKRQQKIDALTKSLEQIELELSQTDKEVSRLNFLIEQDFYKLDTLKKQLMDAVKITARNIFYLLFQPFKEAYDNFRDDHVLFRHLTRAHGLMQQQGEVVKVLLLTEVQYPPKVALIIDDILHQLNNNRMIMPDNSGRTLQFSLLQNDQMVFGVKPRKMVET